jgi:hypothetical protein
MLHIVLVLVFQIIYCGDYVLVLLDYVNYYCMLGHFAKYP